MSLRHVAFKAEPPDETALRDIANALPRLTFPTQTATIRAALTAAGHLARQGLLMAVLAEAKAAKPAQ